MLAAVSRTRRVDLNKAAPWVLLLAVTLVWPSSLYGPFQFDDWNVIVDNPAVHSLAQWWQSMPGIRPLLKLSYALNWLTDSSALGFHLVNLCIHGLNVVLVWTLMRYWPNPNPAAAFWVALMFALHPVQTEAVTYISGRSMSLMSMFWLLSAICWLSGQSGQQPGRLASILAVVCFVLALLVRETAWSLPFLMLLWQRSRGSSWGDAIRSLWPLWATLAMMAIILMLIPGYPRLLQFSLQYRDPLANLAAQVHGYAYLFTEPLLFLRSNIDPALPRQAEFDSTWWLSAVLLLSLLVLGWRALRSHPDVGLALLWPLVMLFPTNGLIARLDLAADRHLYLALIGPAWLCVKTLRMLPSRYRNALPAAVCLVLALTTWQRIQDYRSESALWLATSKYSPGKPRVWNNLGYAYLIEGRPEAALAPLQQAIRLSPGFVRAQINLELAEQASKLQR